MTTSASPVHRLHPAAPEPHRVRLISALTAAALVIALAPTSATTSSAATAPAATAPAATAPAAGPADHRVIVRVAGDVRGADLASAVGGQVVHEIGALDAVVLDVPAGAGDTIATRLAARDDVVDVERDAVAVTAQVVPNDQFWELQWGLRQIEAPTAWTATTGNEAVTIAVLDTGVEASHPDLADGVEPGANFTNEGAADDVSDDHGHGTHAAGIAAARADNELGIAGACWTCRILPVKVLGADGVGRLSDIAAGMVWAVDHDADVLNLSLGSSDDVGLMRDAVSYAVSRDVAMVASAGNFGNAAGDPPSQTEVYPAAYDDVIGVAGNDEDGDRHTASSFGDWVDVTAAMCNPATDLDGAYAWFCGTSASGPLVAGVIGLGLAHEPDASREALTAAITTTAAEVDYVEFGRVDAAATLERLAETVEPEPDPPQDPPEEEPPLPGDPDDDGDDLPDGDEEFTTDPGLSLQRVSGANRFDTAARLSAANIAPGGDRVYVATGSAFPDALAAGSAAGRDGSPILLAARDGLPAETRAELARLGPAEVVVVGGVNAVSDEVAKAAGEAAGARVRRIAGSDRFDTAARIARERFDSPVETAFVATGTGFADALAGVPAAVTRNAPVLLVTRDQLPAATADALGRLRSSANVVLGGWAVVSQEVEAAAGEASAAES